MKKINGIEFADSIGVLYALKEALGHTTLQETYRVLEQTDMDSMMLVLHTAYNKAHKEKPVTFDQFLDLLEENKLGLLKVAETYQSVAEALMFSGMTEAEIAERKNFIMNLKK